MTRTYVKRATPRAPLAASGLQLNCCRNALCASFGLAPIDGIGRWQNREILDAYVAIGSGADSVLRCRACGEHTSLISNAAVAEERDRLLAFMALPAMGSCRTEGCEHRGHDVREHPQDYLLFGRTESGSQRFRCRACGKTFSVTHRATHRLRQPDKTVEVFRYLINRVAMRRLCEIADISADTLYQRIGLIYERCRAFAAHHERPLLDGKDVGRVHVAIDRQQHTLNWGSSLDKRSSVLLATVSAVAKSGYILAQHLNFDPDVDAFELDLLAREAGDVDLPPCFRRYARLWLPHERMEPYNAGAELASPSTGSDEVRPTARGAMIHDNVALLAHFQVIKQLLSGAKSIQLSMDREAGIERAALVTFAERVGAGTLDAYLVRIRKETSVALKRRLVGEAEIALAEACAARPASTELEVIRALIAERYQAACERHPRHRDRWVMHPYPTMSEPERASMCLTATPERSLDHLLSGFSRASLRTVDRYFMQVRRRIHLLERPTQSASSNFRSYYAYSPYSAVVVMRLLEIFRVAFNFHLRGEQATTPAMRFGLATQPYELDEIIEFTADR